MAKLPTTNRIKELRDAAGMSQDELARRVGTTQQQVGRHERGIRRLTIQWINRYAQAFEVSPQAIIAEGVPESLESDVTAITDMSGFPGVSEAIAARELRIYRVDRSLVTSAGVVAGAVITVDESDAARDAAKSGDVVLVRFEENILSLRQYVHPNLITTNAPGPRNVAMRTDDKTISVVIVGVVIRA